MYRSRHFSNSSTLVRMMGLSTFPMWGLWRGCSVIYPRWTARISQTKASICPTWTSSVSLSWMVGNVCSVIGVLTTLRCLGSRDWLSLSHCNFMAGKLAISASISSCFTVDACLTWQTSSSTAAKCRSRWSSLYCSWSISNLHCCSKLWASLASRGTSVTCFYRADFSSNR